MRWKFMLLSDDEKKLLKLTVSIKNKRKVRDLVPIYNYANSLGLNDESIQKVLITAAW